MSAEKKRLENIQSNIRFRQARQKANRESERAITVGPITILFSEDRKGWVGMNGEITSSEHAARVYCTKLARACHGH